MVRTLLPDLAVALRLNNSAEPAREGQRILQLMELVESFEKRVLCGVLRFMRIAQVRLA
jgi:hypothetical protein